MALCKYCDGQTNLHFENVAAFYFSSKLIRHYWACEVCGSFTASIASSSQGCEKDAYENYHTQNTPENVLIERARSKARRFRRLRRILRRLGILHRPVFGGFPFGKTPISILDYGSGTGQSALFLKLMGNDVTCFEPFLSDHAMRACQSARVEVVDDVTKLIPKKYDLILLDNVLEHVPEPRRLLLDLANLVSPGGRLWVAVPTSQSLSIRIFGHYSRSLESPTHLTMPSSAGLRVLVNSTPWSVLNTCWNYKSEIYSIRETRKMMKAAQLPMTLPQKCGLILAWSNRIFRFSRPSELIVCLQRL
jgi:2-polyprenyl-3-methyl-5-hydroxy-6-metoxy-1,4-benzoquinol methylase